MADRLLWSSYPLVAYRCYPLLPSVQATACKSIPVGYRTRLIDRENSLATLRSGNVPKSSFLPTLPAKLLSSSPFTRSVPTLVWPHSTFPSPLGPSWLLRSLVSLSLRVSFQTCMMQERADDRLLPLRRSPSSTLGTSLQEHPQATPRVLCPYRSSRRIRPPT
jgi:hypothetical protein